MNGLQHEAAASICVGLSVTREVFEFDCNGVSYLLMNNVESFHRLETALGEISGTVHIICEHSEGHGAIASFLVSAGFIVSLAEVTDVCAFAGFASADEIDAKTLGKFGRCQPEKLRRIDRALIAPMRRSRRQSWFARLFAFFRSRKRDTPPAVIVELPPGRSTSAFNRHSTLNK